MRLLVTAYYILSIAIGVNSDAHDGNDSNGYCSGSCTTDASGNKECTFTSIVDMFASEWGYYTFKECGAKTNPTLALEVGVTYTFDQSDVSNYMHPLGFAYYADGAHDDKDELEPVVSPPESGSDCDQTATCPAPMYMLNGEYLGIYSNNNLVKNVTTNEDNFGLDDYEPKFFLPIVDWTEQGSFRVKLKIDEAITPLKDIFYFCHIHQLMTGRIKIISKDGTPINSSDDPVIPYNYDEPSTYDKSCGTFNLTDYQLPHGMCPEKFVCNVPEDDNQATNELRDFTSCIESMDCAMMVGMTNGVSAQSELALFIHQMIPHHQNAVNMAKALLKTEKVTCGDITGESDECVMEQILRSIISGQNHQIQQMRAILEGKNYPLEDACILSQDMDPNVRQSSEVKGKNSAKGIGSGGSRFVVVGALSLLSSFVLF